MNFIWFLISTQCYSFDVYNSFSSFMQRHCGTIEFVLNSVLFFFFLCNQIFILLFQIHTGRTHRDHRVIHTTRAAHKYCSNLYYIIKKLLCANCSPVRHAPPTIFARHHGRLDIEIELPSRTVTSKRNDRNVRRPNKF